MTSKPDKATVTPKELSFGDELGPLCFYRDNDIRYVMAMWNAGKRLAAYLGEKDELALAERLRDDGLVGLADALQEMTEDVAAAIEEAPDRVYSGLYTSLGKGSDALAALKGEG